MARLSASQTALTGQGVGEGVGVIVGVGVPVGVGVGVDGKGILIQACVAPSL